MSKDAEPIVRMVDDFGAPSTNHELRIKEAQLHRALDRYLDGEPADREARPPLDDAFSRREIHRWLGMYQIGVNKTTPGERTRDTSSGLRDLGGAGARERPSDLRHAQRHHAGRVGRGPLGTRLPRYARRRARRGRCSGGSEGNASERTGGTRCSRNLWL